MQTAKQRIKQLLLLITTCFFIGISFSSCEKELYEDAIHESPKGTINNVNINDVPFLIPSVEKFNKDYSFLSDPLKVKNTNKDGENLNLNLEQIIEYVQANGLKSYSIAIKKEFGINDDLYFENLTIYEKEGEYKSFIFKYNQEDDTQKFDLNTFSGSLDVYDINYGLLQTINMIEGRKACVKINNGDWHIVIYPNGVITVYNSSTGFSDSTDPYFGSNPGTENGSSPGGGNSPGTSGPSGSNPTNGSTGTTTIITGGSSPNNGSSEAVLVPNPLEEFKAKRERNFSQTLQNANQASCFGSQSTDFKVSTYQYLEFTLIDDDGLTAQTETYPQEDVADVQAALQDVCDSNTPGETPSIIPFLIEKNIDDTQLDPCAKSILNRLKNNTNNDIATMLLKLGNPSSLYNLHMKSIYPIDPNAWAITYWDLDTSSQIIPYNYTIKIRPDFTSISTDLAIAGSMLHEITRAYFLSLIDDCNQTGNCSALASYPELWNFYFSTQNNNNGTNQTDLLSQHTQLANSFVKSIASALQEFSTGSPTVGLPDQVYMDIAWYGLKGCIPYDSLPQIDRTRIEFRFEIIEVLNQNGVDSNFQTITPQGVRLFPC